MPKPKLFRKVVDKIIEKSCRKNDGPNYIRKRTSKMGHKCTHHNIWKDSMKMKNMIYEFKTQ